MSFYGISAKPKVIIPPPPEVKIDCGKGLTFTINCTAIGGPVPEISWRRNWGHVPSKCTQSSKDGFGTLTCTDIRVLYHFIASGAPEGTSSVMVVTKFPFTGRRPGGLQLWGTQHQRNRPGRSWHQPRLYRTSCFEGLPIRNVQFCRPKTRRMSQLLRFRSSYFLQECRFLHFRNTRTFGSIQIDRSESISRWHRRNSSSHYLQVDGTEHQACHQRIPGESPPPTLVNVGNLQHFIMFNECHQLFSRATPDESEFGENVIPYFVMPDAYRGNQLKSYGGHFKYTLMFDGNGRPIIAPDVIITVSLVI